MYLFYYSLYPALKWRLSFLLFLIVYSLGSQNKKYIDSLENAYNKVDTDTARFNNLVDQIAYYRLGDNLKAREKVQLITQLAQRINNLSYTAGAKFQNAVQFRKEGNYDSSIVYYMEAIRLYEHMNNEKYLSVCYASIGIAYWQLKEYEPALRYLWLSHKYILKENKPVRVLANYNNIGGIYFDRKMYDSALFYLNKCKSIAEEIKDTASMADANGNMGSIYLLKGDTAKAMHLSLLGAEYAKKTGYKYQLFTSYSNIANVLVLQKEYKKAEKYFLISLSIAKELGAIEGIRDNYKGLSELYHASGEDQKAYYHLQQYIHLNDSLINESRMKQITGLEAKYNSEKKDKELLREKAESQKKSAIAFALLIGLISVFVLAFIAFRGYLNKRKYANEIQVAKQLIELKSNELASRNKDVTDSINYAKRIQYAVLPREDTIQRGIPFSFIFYKPKDIVSGDFFWFHELNSEEYILVCADCTGHGVPGALMTVIGSNLLNQTIIDNKFVNPSVILKELDRQINFTLKQQNETDISVQDGMDLCLIKVNKIKNEILITGAKRPAFFIRNKQLQEVKGSKYSLGGIRSGEKIFEEVKVNFIKGDSIYLFTDGFADQFGGEKGKKYSTKRLKEFLIAASDESVARQKSLIENEFLKWRGKLEQVDDICVIGIKF